MNLPNCVAAGRTRDASIVSQPSNPNQQYHFEYVVVCERFMCADTASLSPDPMLVHAERAKLWPRVATGSATSRT